VGIPTVTFTTSEFIALAENTALSQGAADMCFVVVPHPMGMIPASEIKKKAEEAFQEMIKVMMDWESKASLPTKKEISPYPAEVFKYKGSDKDVNEMFFKKGWALGVPIIPPTPERVREILAGTSHKPDEIIGKMPPREGIVTVEMVAVHAAMAGCKPEYMPLLLAITETLVRPEYRGPATTTHPTAPLFIVNGPIRDEIGIAYSTGAGGTGSLANVTIGLVINSLGDIIGGARPPDVDKSTMAWSGNIIAMVIGENEEANPWAPLHVDKGFKKNENIITVMLGADIPSNISDHFSVTGEDLLRVIAYEMRRGGQNSHFMKDCEVLVILGPEHAATTFNDGWNDKDKIKKYLWAEAAIPVRAQSGGGKYPRYNPEEATKLLGFPAATMDTPIPMVMKPENIQIIVSGGPGKHSKYVSSKAEIPRMICVPIDKWR